MIILGYSGLDAAMRHINKDTDLRPGEERMVQGLDSAAAIVVDGQIVAAAAEERFCDQKHTNKFPQAAIEFCLETAGVSLSDVDVVAHGFDYGRSKVFFRKFDADYYDEVLAPENQLALWHERFGGSFAEGKFKAVPHHIAHAASAYFPAGFDEALCVVCDGMGELESLTVYSVERGIFSRLATVSIPNSIGLLYSIVTKHLGFKFNADEYKLMGLAPYGNPEKYREFFANLIDLQDAGRYQLRYDRWIGDATRDTYHRSILAYLENNIFASPDDVDTMVQDHYDFTAAAQEALEKTLTHVISHWRSETGLRKLCMAGGVALNCTYNGKLLDSGLFDETYIQPAAGDDGTALGAAVYESFSAGEKPFAGRYQEMPFYGPAYTSEEVLAATHAFADKIEVHEFSSVDEAAKDAAIGMKDDLVQAWFQDRMEFGPRALGNRTILANPASPDIKSRVNQIIKLREGFRPFAPAVLEERAHEYFELDAEPSPFEYMLATCQVKAQWAPRLPGITHVDGSARVQTVSKAKNPGFHNLIQHIGDQTGIYCTMNTSFNIRSQPMIAAPDVAIDTLLRVKIDRLYLQNVRISKRAGA